MLGAHVYEILAERIVVDAFQVCVLHSVLATMRVILRRVVKQRRVHPLQ